MCLKGYTKSGFAEKIFHIHIRVLNNHKELYFRDFLRDHPDIAQKYGDLKLELMKKYKHHRDNYTNSASFSSTSHCWVVSKNLEEFQSTFLYCCWNNTRASRFWYCK